MAKTTGKGIQRIFHGIFIFFKIRTSEPVELRPTSNAGKRLFKSKYFAALSVPSFLVALQL